MPVYLLDTDHMSLLERGGAEGQRIRERLRSVPPDDVATTIVSYDEQSRGRSATVAKASTAEKQIAAYRWLSRLLLSYCIIAVADFDERAAAEFNRLRSAGVRIGTMDLRIASIALANGAILLSRNLSHFRRVPGLRVEDWSA